MTHETAILPTPTSFEEVTSPEQVHSATEIDARAMSIINETIGENGTDSGMTLNDDILPNLGEIAKQKEQLAAFQEALKDAKSPLSRRIKQLSLQKEARENAVAERRRKDHAADEQRKKQRKQQRKK